MNTSTDNDASLITIPTYMRFYHASGCRLVPTGNRDPLRISQSRFDGLNNLDYLFQISRLSLVHITSPILQKPTIRIYFLLLNGPDCSAPNGEIYLTFCSKTIYLFLMALSISAQVGMMTRAPADNGQVYASTVQKFKPQTKKYI